jgi:iron(III) transport system ATP-binding protein
MTKKLNFFRFVYFFSLLIPILFIFGCDGKNETPSLKFSKVSSIQMPPDGERIPAPRSLATGKDDKLIVLDDVGRVLIFDKKGKLVKQWWMPEYKLGRPEGVCELKDGRIAITNTHYSKVVIFKPDGVIDLIFSRKGTGNGELSSPVGISEDPEGNLYVCEYGPQDRVQQFTSDGKFIRSIGNSGTGPGQFQRPSGVTLNNKKLYVVDAVNNRIQLFEESGKFIKSITVSPSFYLPYDLKFDKYNYIYVVEYGNACVTKLNPDGTLVGRFYPESRFRTPWGIAVNSAGTVYVADTGNRRIRVLTP